MHTRSHDTSEIVMPQRQIMSPVSLKWIWNTYIGKEKKHLNIKINKKYEYVIYV